MDFACQRKVCAQDFRAQRQQHVGAFHCMRNERRTCSTRAEERNRRSWLTHHDGPAPLPRRACSRAARRRKTEPCSRRRKSRLAARAEPTSFMTAGCSCKMCSPRSPPRPVPGYVVLSHDGDSNVSSISRAIRSALPMCLARSKRRSRIAFEVGQANTTWAALAKAS